VLKLIDMDPNTAIQDQLAADTPGPVVLINLFSVAAVEADTLATAWADDAAYFKRQPGFISAQLHRGVGLSSMFMNYAVWESLAAFAAAFGNPEFQRKLAAYPTVRWRRRTSSRRWR
jgi:heme-degrading monooxygenase HmoA